MKTRLKNPTETLEKSLKRLRIIVNAQPNVADKSFFDAALNYKRARTKIVNNELLKLDRIKAYDKEYHMLMAG